MWEPTHNHCCNLAVLLLRGLKHHSSSAGWRFLSILCESQAPVHVTVPESSVMNVSPADTGTVYWRLILLPKLECKRTS